MQNIRKNVMSLFRELGVTDRRTDRRLEGHEFIGPFQWSRGSKKWLFKTDQKIDANVGLVRLPELN